MEHQIIVSSNAGTVQDCYGEKELSWKAKLSINQWLYDATLTSSHELWVVIERIGSWIQEAKVSFFHKVARLGLKVGVQRE